MDPRRSRILAPVATLLGLGLLWLAPVSPLALSRADVAVGQGDPGRAVRIYDQVSTWSPLPGVRRRALSRAAAVYASELNDPEAARARLEALVRRTAPTGARLGEVQARIGELYLRERRPLRAARAFLAAVDADPDALQAADRTALAAVAYQQAGRVRKAEATWSRLATEHPPWRGRARLGQAELLLARGDAVRALARFREVLAHGRPEEQSAARLGLSICLERLGELDEAMAAIVEADLPDGVRQSRTHALRARQAWIP